MLIKVRFFAGLREAAHTSTVDLKLEQGATVADALTHLQALFPQLTLHEGLAYAVNQTYSSTTTLLNPDDELALIPPVSGG